MGENTGMDGSMKLDGVTFVATKWDFNEKIKTAETTPIGSFSETHIPLTDGTTGSITCSSDPSITEQKTIHKMLSAAVRKLILLELVLITGNEFHFSAVVTGFSLPKGANDADVFTIDWVKTGVMYDYPGEA